MFTNGLFRSGRRQKSNVYIRRHQGAKCARWALVTRFITNFHTAPLSIRSMGKTLTSCIIVVLQRIVSSYLTPDILGPGEAGVWGFGEVMGLWNLAPPPSCLPRELGDPDPAGFVWDKLNTSIVSTGDGGLSSSVIDRRRTLPPVTESSTYMFKNA